MHGPPRRIALSLGAALGLAACVTVAPVPPVLDLATVRCTADPSRDAAIATRIGEVSLVEIDGRTACLEQPDGTRGSFALLRLPEAGEPYLVDIRSVPLRGGTLLAPRVAVLDASGTRLRERRHDEFVFRGASLHLGLRIHPDDHYLLVTSDTAAIGRRESRLQAYTLQTMAPVGRGFMITSTGGEATQQIVYAHNGRLEIEPRPLPTVR